MCISKSSINDKRELSLDWVIFIVGNARHFSRDIARQEILCRIVSNGVKAYRDWSKLVEVYNYLAVTVILAVLIAVQSL